MLKLLLLIAIAVLYFSGARKIKCNHLDTSAFNLQTTMPLRGLLAIMIVICHVCSQRTQMPLSSEIGGLAYVVVAIFFFLSGYGLMTSLSKKGDSYLENFLNKRFLKLLPIFIICNIVYICSTVNYPPPFWSNGLIHILTNLLQGTVPFPYSWFIYAILWFYIVFYVSCRLVSENSFRALLITAATIVSSVILYMIDFGYYWYVSSIAFGLGTIVVVQEEHVKNVFVKYGPYVIATIVAIIGVAMTLHNALVQQIALSCIFPLLIYALAIVNRLNISNAILNFCGKISLEIYLAQGFIIQSNWMDRTFTSWITFLIVALSLDIILAYLINSINNHIIKRIFNR
jgi:peptidoglycan/LPS O-acetylase OafA/YrhL